MKWRFTLKAEIKFDISIDGGRTTVYKDQILNRTKRYNPTYLKDRKKVKQLLVFIASGMG